MLSGADELNTTLSKVYERKSHPSTFLNLLKQKAHKEKKKLIPTKALQHQNFSKGNFTTH